MWPDKSVSQISDASLIHATEVLYLPLRAKLAPQALEKIACCQTGHTQITQEIIVAGYEEVKGTMTEMQEVYAPFRIKF